MLMSLFAYTPLPPMSLFVTNFGYPPPPYPSDVIFQCPLKKPVECFGEKSYWLSATTLVIFLSFGNFFVILELATQLI